VGQMQSVGKDVERGCQLQDIYGRIYSSMGFGSEGEQQLFCTTAVMQPLFDADEHGPNKR
jgi:hypothetical protein